MIPAIGSHVTWSAGKRTREGIVQDIRGSGDKMRVVVLPDKASPGNATALVKPDRIIE